VGTPTQTLHRLTSLTWEWYEPSRDDEDLLWTAPVDDPLVVQLEPNDLERFPWFFKRYPDSLPRVNLPRGLPSTSASAIAVLAGTANVAPRDLDLDHLSRLLHLSAGVVRTWERPYTMWLFRAAGSAGGRFPLELYVSVPEGTKLPPGVHWYHPLDHALVQIGPPPHGGAPAIVVTGVPWRTGWRYRERGYRHVYWDAGTMLAQLLAAADSAGFTAKLFTRFPDRTVAGLVGIDRIHEFPVAVVALGDGIPAVDATGPAAIGEVDAAPLEFPLVTHAQRAGERESLGPSWGRGDPANVGMADGKPIEAVILARGTQRLMDPDGRLSGQVLETSMTVAMRGVDIPHFIVAHRVDDVRPGIYRWPDLTDPVRSGDLREELFRICLDQGLGSDAAFVVIGAEDVASLDDCEYREAQLGAGLVEGRLHVAAYASGAGASGMTFIDSEIPSLLGEPLDGLLFTCVGVPAYPSAPGGHPGRPTSIRMVTPR
jgi:hypothetical protein